MTDGREVLDQHVRGAAQLEQELAAALGLQVQDDAALAAVQRAERIVAVAAALRDMSPCGGSILITSAPAIAIRKAAYGPWKTWPRSRTRTPVSGKGHSEARGLRRRLRRSRRDGPGPRVAVDVSIASSSCLLDGSCRVGGRGAMRQRNHGRAGHHFLVPLVASPTSSGAPRGRRRRRSPWPPRGRRGGPRRRGRRASGTGRSADLRKPASPIQLVSEWICQQVRWMPTS